MPEVTPEYAACVLAWMEADPDGFAAACTETRPDDPEGLASEMLDVFSQLGGAEEDANPNDAPDSEVEGEAV